MKEDKYYRPAPFAKESHDAKSHSFTGIMSHSLVVSD